MAVKVLDAGGGKVLLSGDERAQVEAALQRYVAHGSKVIAVVAQVGPSWVASCTAPARVESMDDTQTLRLADIIKESPTVDNDDDSLCNVEAIGFKRIITGPTRVLVTAKVDELRHFGATPIGEVEEVDGQWTAMVDTAGTQNTGFRW